MADDPGPRYNVAPTDPAAVVVERPDGIRGVTLFSWGLVPHWAGSAGRRRSPHQRPRGDGRGGAGIPGRPAGAIAASCPADGFFEWTRDGSTRQPHFIRRRDRQPLALAGLWASWRPTADAPSRRSFTIITTRANDAIAPLHDRMPVALAPERVGTLAGPDGRRRRRAARASRAA